jgi:hypothetical protein
MEMKGQWDYLRISLHHTRQLTWAVDPSSSPPALDAGDPLPGLLSRLSICLLYDARQISVNYTYVIGVTNSNCLAQY